MSAACSFPIAEVLVVEHLQASLESHVGAVVATGGEDAECALCQGVVDAFSERRQINWHNTLPYLSYRPRNGRHSRGLFPNHRRNPRPKELNRAHYLVVRHRPDAEVKQEAVVFE